MLDFGDPVALLVHHDQDYLFAISKPVAIDENPTFVLAEIRDAE